MKTGSLAKHNIKRVSRFVGNSGVCIADGLKGLIVLAAKAAGGRLIVAVDWVDIRQFKVLRAAVPIRGRSIPILFAAYPKWKLRKSQNAFEHGFVVLLAALLPRGTEAVIIADRGFTRAQFARDLQEHGLHYVVRSGGKVHFSSGMYSGILDNIPLKRGGHIDLGIGRYRKTKPVERRIVAYWHKDYKEPWILATDLDWGWRKIVGIFRHRMMIEELFRDEKNIRYGWGLRQIMLTSADRLERMLLVLAFAYLLLLMIGLVCADTLSPGHWASSISKRRKQNSIFFIGRRMFADARLRPRKLLHALSLSLTQIMEENWG